MKDWAKLIEDRWCENICQNIIFSNQLENYGFPVNGCVNV